MIALSPGARPLEIKMPAAVAEYLIGCQSQVAYTVGLCSSWEQMMEQGDVVLLFNSWETKIKVALRDAADENGKFVIDSLHRDIIKYVLFNNSTAMKKFNPKPSPPTAV